MTELGEIVPGLFIEPYMPKGKVFRLGRDEMFMPVGGTAVHPETWNKLSPAKQELVRDLYVKHASLAGQQLLEEFLSQHA